MAAKLIQSLRQNSLVEFVKETQKILDAELAQQIQEVEAVVFKTKPVNEGFSKKHFELAAATLKDIPDKNKRKQLADEHAKTFKAANPLFSRSKFFRAAGLAD